MHAAQQERRGCRRELPDATRADDFTVSEKLISLLLTQVSENRDLTAFRSAVLQSGRLHSG